MSKKATEAYMTSRREDQRDAWYAGADAVLEASMKAAQKAINNAEPHHQDMLYKMAAGLYAAAEAAFTQNPFRPEAQTKPPVLPPAKAVPAPTIEREPGTAERTSK